MERLKLTIRLFITTAILAGIGPFATGNQENTSIANNKDILQDIEKYIAQSRKTTESYYAARLKELNLKATKKIKQLEKDEYAEMTKSAVSIDVLLGEYGFIPSNYISYKPGLMLPMREKNLADEQIARQKKNILANLARNIESINKQKSYALDKSLPYLKKRMIEDAIKPKPEPARGVVTGIVYSADKQMALIDKKIVRPEDTIHGVKVVKINRNGIEFEKNKAVWKQKVREKAKAFWK